MWRFFSYETDPMLACPCDECQAAEHKGQLMDAAFMTALDNLRAKIGKPFKVFSGYRCPAYNAMVSNTGDDGPHTTGKAVDLQVYGDTVWNILAELKGRGFYGVGLRQHGAHEGRFVHLDSLDPGEADAPRPWVWSYGD